LSGNAVKSAGQLIGVPGSISQSVCGFTVIFKNGRLLMTDHIAGQPLRQNFECLMHYLEPFCPGCTEINVGFFISLLGCSPP
jgi:hypothetical protein